SSETKPANGTHLQKGRTMRATASAADHETRIAGALDQTFERLRRRFTQTPEERDRFERREAANRAHHANPRRATTLHALPRELGTRYSRDRVSLDRFEVYDPRQPPVLQRVREIAEGMRGFIESGQSVAIFGPVGCGKDHLLAHLLYIAADEGF